MYEMCVIYGGEEAKDIGRIGRGGAFLDPPNFPLFLLSLLSRHRS